MGHTVSGARYVEEDDDAPMDVGGVQSGHKLGGTSHFSRDAKRAAAEAALLRSDSLTKSRESFVSKTKFYV